MADENLRLTTARRVLIPFAGVFGAALFTGMALRFAFHAFRKM